MEMMHSALKALIFQVAVKFAPFQCYHANKFFPGVYACIGLFDSMKPKRYVIGLFHLLEC